MKCVICNKPLDAEAIIYDEDCCSITCTATKQRGTNCICGHSAGNHSDASLACLKCDCKGYTTKTKVIIVSTCPRCGAPIYGNQNVINDGVTRPQITYSCNCRNKI